MEYYETTWLDYLLIGLMVLVTVGCIVSAAMGIGMALGGNI